MESRTRLYKRLEAGKPTAGFLLGLNSPALTELLVGGTELDFVAVGLQHGDVSAGDATHMLRAIQAADPMVTPLARVPNDDVYWLHHVLDAGYMGVIVPLVESAETCRKLVRSVYYPPRGSRSVAASVRASLYPDYLQKANDQMILLPQIESATGLERVEEIVGVEGVSGVLMGPGDLSLDRGWHGEDLWHYEPFLAAARRIVEACRQVGRIAAILTGPDGVVPAGEMGFNMIGVGCDQAFVRSEMAAAVAGRARLVSQRDALQPHWRYNGQSVESRGQKATGQP
jgi:2-keto-3-deoxy-L-rhamnonate aldolase RhmA